MLQSELQLSTIVMTCGSLHVVQTRVASMLYTGSEVRVEADPLS